MSRMTSLAVAAGLAATMSLSSLPSATAAVSAAAEPTAEICTSATHPTLARKLSADIQTALQGRASSYGLAVYDEKKKLTCGLNADWQNQTASVIKVMIAGTLLRMTRVEQNRFLTPEEDADAIKMITESDDAAASRLWVKVGMGRLNEFVRLTGMNATVLRTDGWWGRSLFTANDQLKMLRTLDRPNDVLPDRCRTYILDLMAKVVPDQRWGTPAGAPSAVKVYVKNGWMSRGDENAWYINSDGLFTGANHHYGMSVLTVKNQSMPYGIETVERVARAVHRHLGA